MKKTPFPPSLPGDLLPPLHEALPIQAEGVQLEGQLLLVPVQREATPPISNNNPMPKVWAGMQRQSLF